ncbi:protein kinase family protein [Xanthomonas campestris]|uniref:hypothetical protein n=1 Tax=Xanthomonas campestris TaxID=339 RepID=UPI0023EA1FC6|nr:serine/threonine-protein kinase [Xanthomonas campestris]
MDERQALYLRAKGIVAAADELPPDERADFVARECAGDAALLAEAPELSGEQFSADAARDYRVLHRLGQGGMGGMGVVYLAERQQDGFTQRVALKLLRRVSGDARTALERFQRERALLARLEHHGIARLVDGGLLSDGQPFLAIEYVEGEHIVKNGVRFILGDGVRFTYQSTAATCGLIK